MPYQRSSRILLVATIAAAAAVAGGASGAPIPGQEAPTEISVLCLAALVIYGRLMRSDPRGLPTRLDLESPYAPDLSLDDETAARLQEAAAVANAGGASEACRR